MTDTDKIEQNLTSETGESPFSLLTDSQWRFVTAMTENPSWSKKEAAEYIGLNPRTVYAWDTYVDNAILIARKNIHAAAIERRKQALLKAIAVKIALLDSDDESVRSKAATELIEWELGKAKQMTEITGKDGGSQQHEHTFKWEQLMQGTTDGSSATDDTEDPFA